MHPFRTTLFTLLAIGFVGSAVIAPKAEAQPAARKPNVIIFLADDEGYGLDTRRVPL